MENIRIANKYLLKSTIGQGGFGDVYKCQDIKSGKERAIKMERRMTGEMIFYEGKILQYLKDVVGTPMVYDFGLEGDYNYMVMDYCGYSLGAIHTACKNKFSLKTTCQIGLQILNILETVHNRYILHRDIKPENFLFDPSTDRFYLIDFGLSKRYVDKNGKHIPRLENKGFRGTLRYCSLNMHLGVENTRRDDLESLLYVLIYFLKGKLPWQNIQAEMDNKVSQIKKLKMTMKIADLCEGLDEGFKEMLSYIRNLGFSDYPDYDKIRKTFRDILKRNNLK